MKSPYALFLFLAVLPIVGCNPDHSGDTISVPIPKAKQTAVDQNPYVPDAAKKTLKSGTGIPPAASTGQ